MLPERDHEQVERIIELCERHRVRWRVMPRVAQSMALTVEMVGAIPLIGPPGSNIEGLNCIVKRGFDIAVATLMIDGGVADFVARRDCDPLARRRLRCCFARPGSESMASHSSC